METKFFILSAVALVLWPLGYPDQALEKSKTACTMAQERSHPLSVVGAHILAAMCHQHRREILFTQERAASGLPLAREHGFPNWLAQATILLGWALAEQGQVEEGMSQIRQGLATQVALRVGLFQSYFLALLAEAYGKARQIEEGLATLAEALTLADRTGERMYEAELYRLKGQLTLVQSSV